MTNHNPVNIQKMMQIEKPVQNEQDITKIFDKEIKKQKKIQKSTMQQLLLAVNEVLDQTKQPKTPLTYFISFVSTLDKEKRLQYIIALLRFIFLVHKK